MFIVGNKYLIYVQICRIKYYFIFSVLTLKVVFYCDCDYVY